MPNGVGAVTIHRQKALLQALETAEELRTLHRHVPVPTFMRALNFSRSERAHSRMIAYLLSRDDIAIGGGLVRELLLWAADQLGREDPAVAIRVRTVAESLSLAVECRVERWSIDVVAEVVSPAGSILLGIENKIDAPERKGQLAQYQKRLGKQCGERTPLLLFLTADGREPRTSAKGTKVPVVSISYREFLEHLNVVIQDRSRGGAVTEVVSNFQRHIREEIVGDSHVKGLVLDLWRRHPEAMRLAMKYRPRLDDIKEVYLEALQDGLDEELLIRTYPNRGHLREIKMTPKQWWDGRMPLTFMLYSPDAGRPSVRLLVGNPQFEQHKDRLQAWAESLDKAALELPINISFPRRGWWHELLRENVEQGSEDTEPVCDEDTAVAAADKVLAWLESLRPTIDPFLEEDG